MISREISAELSTHNGLFDPAHDTRERSGRGPDLEGRCGFSSHQKELLQSPESTSHDSMHALGPPLRHAPCDCCLFARPDGAWLDTVLGSRAQCG